MMRRGIDPLTSWMLRLLVALLIGCTATRRPDEIDRIANEALSQGDAVGISIAVARGDAIDSRGYGFADREARVPATAESVYPLASLSKQFWAAAALQPAPADVGAR